MCVCVAGAGKGRPSPRYFSVISLSTTRGTGAGAVEVSQGLWVTVSLQWGRCVTEEQYMGVFRAWSFEEGVLLT